jgi:ribokinase
VTADLIVAGKLAIDEISFQGKQYPPQLGGSAAHVALAASAVGCRVAIVSTIGEDFPSIFIERLQEKRIDLSGVRRISGRSSRFWVDFNIDGSMSDYGLHFGVGNQLSLQEYSRLIQETRAVHLGILPPYLQRRLISRSSTKKALMSMTTIFHHAGKYREQILSNLQFLDILFLNQEEAQILSGKSSSLKAIQKLGKQVSIVAVTLGAKGVIVNDKGDVMHIPGFQINSIDTTGAGDSFAGAFLATYLRTNDVNTAAEWGNAAGALNCSGVGSQRMITASRRDIEKLLERRQKV